MAIIKEAIKHFNQAIDMDSNNILAFYERARAKMGLEDSKGALEDFNAAIKIDPNCALPYAGRGVMKMRLAQELSSEKGEERDDLDKAMELDPSLKQGGKIASANKKSKDGKGEDDTKDNRKTEADKSVCKLEEYLKNTLAPEEVIIEKYFQRGEMKFSDHNYKGAIGDYNEVIKRLPDYADPYEERGNAKFKLEDNKGSLKDYEKAIDINSSFAKAHYMLGLAKKKLNDNKGAISKLDKAIADNPDFAKAYSQRGYAKNKLNDSFDAVKDWEKAVALDSSLKAQLQPEIDATKKKITEESQECFNRGNELYRECNYTGAIKNWEKAIKINPGCKDRVQPLIEQARTMTNVH